MSRPSQHERYIRRCIALAPQAIASGDTPVGSLIVDGDEIVSEGVEGVRAPHDPTAHAEIEALRAAYARRRSPNLAGCTLYTSVEPCLMCAYVYQDITNHQWGWAVRHHAPIAFAYKIEQGHPGSLNVICISDAGRVRRTR